MKFERKIESYINYIKDDFKVIKEFRNSKNQLCLEIKCLICGKTHNVLRNNFKKESRRFNHNSFCLKKISKSDDYYSKKLIKICEGAKGRCTNKIKEHYYKKGIEFKFKNTMEFIDLYLEEYKRKCEEVGIENVTIDRIDSDGNYEVGNIRFATRSEQQSNKTTTIFFKALSPQGEIFYSNNRSIFAREHNLNSSHIGDCLHGRLKTHRKWKFEFISKEQYCSATTS